MRLIPNAKYLSFWIEKLVFWFLLLETGYYNYFDEPMNHAIDALNAILRIGMKPRKYDNPNEDDDSKYNFNFDEVEWTDNGFSRFTAHLATIEAAFDFK